MADAPPTGGERGLFRTRARKEAAPPPEFGPEAALSPGAATSLLGIVVRLQNLEGQMAVLRQEKLGIAGALEATLAETVPTMEMIGEITTWVRAMQDIRSIIDNLKALGPIGTTVSLERLDAARGYATDGRERSLNLLRTMEDKLRNLSATLV